MVLWFYLGQGKMTQSMTLPHKIYDPTVPPILAILVVKPVWELCIGGSIASISPGP